ncbi:NAD(P)/FAD-dependent oxidoreductase [Arthrobacter castelli]|uniref:NAD(P)/FAD-dependent oxidoreductase n=1 Tax=Arthrobacter castelli TaxID=271431 RepID=UPI0004208453|nr:FAD-dependent oxidoreductase [Arthrobacter castelli]
MKVVVIGAGYAGTLAANRLARKVKSAQITMISPRPDFVERIRLHQHIAGTGTAATPLASMLHRSITARIGTVEKIGDGTVALDDGGSIDFDYALLAVGSTVTPMHRTVPVGTWESAERARAALASLPSGATVTVIGGGPTGIETAAEVAGARPDLRVRLVGTSVAGSFSDAARQRIRAGLQRLNAEVIDDDVTEVSAGAGQFEGTVHLQSGAEFTSDLTLWAVVSGTPDLATRSGLEVNPEGRAVVDEFLRSVSDNRIFVIGDCAAVPGARPACQTATPQASHAANALVRLAQGRTPKPHSTRYVARAISLGRRDAVVQFTRRDDSVRRSFASGAAAVVLKEVASGGAKWVARIGPNI